MAAITGPFAAMDRVLFASPVLSLAATYTAPAAAPVAVRVIRCRGDALARLGEVGINRPADLFDLRAADVPVPIRGAALAVTEGGVTAQYQVRAVTPDTSRLVWRLDCARQA
ncbi:hypothetical protein EDC65_2246 [Stella humosa]|uniref:Uncharacterized protein n=1 Tax=Stella humosa TaxID=94 RepID=A0A3N1MCL2_9PROT|nr:hypothetical protein [Stella humosa]ROQ00447.1 hypothetical protein EDC65_2246 [Stella humosa]BBK30308.1 hypothetical protein STHU_09420 [Stella humosa]